MRRGGGGDDKNKLFGPDAKTMKFGTCELQERQCLSHKTLSEQACTTCRTTTLQLRPQSPIMVDNQLCIPKTRLCHMPIHVAMSQNTDTHQHAHNKNVAEHTHTHTRNITDPNPTKHAKVTTFDYARNGPCKTQPPLNPSEHVPGDLGPCSYLIALGFGDS